MHALIIKVGVAASTAVNPAANKKSGNEVLVQVKLSESLSLVRFGLFSNAGWLPGWLPASLMLTLL